MRARTPTPGCTHTATLTSVSLIKQLDWSGPSRVPRFSHTRNIERRTPARGTASKGVAQGPTLPFQSHVALFYLISRFPFAIAFAPPPLPPSFSHPPTLPFALASLSAVSCDRLDFHACQTSDYIDACAREESGFIAHRDTPAAKGVAARFSRVFHASRAYSSFLVYPAW